MTAGMAKVRDLQGWRWALLIGVVMALGLAVRIYKAWTLQYTPDSDHGIVELMARHMAEGRDFPVFFYGQPYMGSLEPAVSALLCRVLGISGFHVVLGTALVGALLLPLIYGWGRAAGGRRAGLVALLLALVGSNTFLHFSVAPRGGYMTMMACGLAVVLLACKLAAGSRRGGRPGVASLAGLGVLAGLGWWSNQLIVPFLLAAGVILLAARSWSLVVRALLPGLLGFAAGSLPWWIWNATHGWSTFDFRESLGRVPPGQGLAEFFKGLAKALDLADLAPLWALVVILVTVVLVAGFLARLMRDAAGGANPETFFYRLAAPVVVLAMMAISVTSHYIAGGAVPRYLLPVLPPLMIMLACGVARVMERRAWLGYGLVLLLLPAHLYRLPALRGDLDYGRRSQARMEQLAAGLAALGSGPCLGEYDYHWMNFASRERLCVATVPLERYAPYSRSLLLAEQPAVLADYLNLQAFLRYSAGSCLETNFAGIPVQYNLRPPSDDWRYLDPQLVGSIQDEAGVLRTKPLTDDTVHTGWSFILREGATAACTVALKEARPLCAVRFISQLGQPPGQVRVEGHPRGATNWVELLPWTTPGSYFWSGPRLEVDGFQAYEELRFAPPAEGLDRLRLTFGLADSRARTISLDELQILEKGAPRTTLYPSVAECLALLRREGVRQVHGPRWMVDAIAALTTGEFTLVRSEPLDRPVNALPRVDSNVAPRVWFREPAGLLMDERDAPRCRTLLARDGQEWHENCLGSLVLLTVMPAASADEARWHRPVYWTEQGCFAEERRRTEKTQAEHLYQQAMDELQHGQTNSVANLLGRSLSLYENHQGARAALVQVLRQRGMTNEAAFQEEALRLQTHPATMARASYACGMQLLGVTLSTNRIAPGQAFDITYFWTCRPDVVTGRYAAFVNFQGAAGRFQDDHVLFEEILPENLAFQPGPEVFSYTHRISVPVPVTAGDYHVVIGVVERHGRERQKPVTTLPVRKQGVQLPAALKIVQEGALP